MVNMASNLERVKGHPTTKTMPHNMAAILQLHYVDWDMQPWLTAYIFDIKLDINISPKAGEHRNTHFGEI